MPQQYRQEVGQSRAPPPPTEAAERGQGRQWLPGDGRPSAGGITGSHNACAWVGSGFASQHQEGEDEIEICEWRRKAQLLCFFLSLYFGNPDSTLLRSFEGLAVFRQGVPKIQACLGLALATA